jgi:hypothetical protein
VNEAAVDQDGGGDAALHLPEPASADYDASNAGILARGGRNGGSPPFTIGTYHDQS